MSETLVEALAKRAMSALRTQLNGQTMPGLHPPGAWSAPGDAGSIDIEAIVRGCLSELDRLGYAVVKKPAPSEPEETKSHYCLDCNRQWYGTEPPCTEYVCPFRSTAAPKAE